MMVVVIFLRFCLDGSRSHILLLDGLLPLVAVLVVQLLSELQQLLLLLLATLQQLLLLLLC